MIDLRLGSRDANSIPGLYSTVWAVPAPTHIFPRSYSQELQATKAEESRDAQVGEVPHWGGWSPSLEQSGDIDMYLTKKFRGGWKKTGLKPGKACHKGFIICFPS